MRTFPAYSVQEGRRGGTMVWTARGNNFSLFFTLHFYLYWHTCTLFFFAFLCSFVFCLLYFHLLFSLICQLSLFLLFFLKVLTCAVPCVRCNCATSFDHFWMNFNRAQLFFHVCFRALHLTEKWNALCAWRSYSRMTFSACFTFLFYFHFKFCCISNSFCFHTSSFRICNAHTAR